MKLLFRSGLIVLAALAPLVARSQTTAIKTNLLLWGTTTPNLSIETALGLRTTLELEGTYNPWKFGSSESNKKIQHWIVKPELRLWRCERYDGGFFGFHALYGRYNAGGINLPLNVFPKLKERRYQGYMSGVGVSYGHQWYLGPHWNLEATFGFGYIYLNYKEYECARCGDFLGRGHKNYFGPTKLGLSFVYLFKSRN